MTSQTTRRKFLNRTTHGAAAAAAATALGGVHAFGAEKCGWVLSVVAES